MRTRSDAFEAESSFEVAANVDRDLPSRQGSPRRLGDCAFRHSNFAECVCQQSAGAAGGTRG